MQYHLNNATSLRLHDFLVSNQMYPSPLSTFFGYGLHWTDAACSLNVISVPNGSYKVNIDKSGLKPSLLFNFWGQAFSKLKPENKTTTKCRMVYGTIYLVTYKTCSQIFFILQQKYWSAQKNKTSGQIMVSQYIIYYVEFMVHNRMSWCWQNCNSQQVKSDFGQNKL